MSFRAGGSSVPQPDTVGPGWSAKTLKLPSLSQLLLKSCGLRDAWWLPIAPVRAVCRVLGRNSTAPVGCPKMQQRSLHPSKARLSRPLESYSRGYGGASSWLRCPREQSHYAVARAHQSEPARETVLPHTFGSSDTVAASLRRPPAPLEQPAGALAACRDDDQRRGASP